MAIAVYPTNLPQSMQRGYREAPRTNVVRTEMDVGPPQSRRRSTTDNFDVSVPLIVSDEQKAAILDFYNNTLENGSLEFQKTDFADTSGTDYIYIFVAEPQFQWLGNKAWSTEYNLIRLREA